MPREQGIQKAIQDYLRDEGAFVFKVITANRNGIPDVIACYQGRFLAIEVKQPGKKLHPLQEMQLNRIQAAGGVAIMATSVDDVKKMLEVL